MNFITTYILKKNNLRIFGTPSKETTDSLPVFSFPDIKSKKTEGQYNATTC